MHLVHKSCATLHTCVVRCFVYVGEENKRYEWDLFFHSLSCELRVAVCELCAVCEPDLPASKKKKVLTAVSQFFQIHRSIWLLIVRLWFDLIFHSFSTFFFSHCAGDYWFYTLRTFIYMCNVVDTTWKTPYYLQFSSCAIGILNFLP